jgi:hypothetical protein
MKTSYRSFVSAHIALLLGFALLPAVPAADWTDPVGDVTLSNADIISGSATVSGGKVDLRVQFANVPFPSTATHDVHWFFDLDQNSATGQNYGGANAFGIEHFIQLNVSLSRGGSFSNCSDIVLFSTINGLDPQSHLWFDPSSNTLRLLFPSSLIGNDGVFNYGLASAFGGSFGANETAPDAGYVTSTTNVLAPFPGIPWCKDGDTDQDGVPNSADQCPDSALMPTVVLRGCDSGVPNRVLPGGCTIVDLISQCSEVSRNHGQFVVCAAEIIAELETAGVLTRKERSALKKCLASSPIRNRSKTLIGPRR